MVPSSPAAAEVFSPATRQSLLDALQDVPDPRGRQGRLYPLAALLPFAVAAMLCGARSLYAIAQGAVTMARPSTGRSASPAGVHRAWPRCTACSKPSTVRPSRRR